MDLILRKREEARCLDVDHFYDMIRTTQDDQILKVLKSSVVREISQSHTLQIFEVPRNQLSQAIIALHQVFLLEIVCILFLTPITAY